MTDNTPPVDPVQPPVAPAVEPTPAVAPTPDPVARVEGAAVVVETALNSIDDLDLPPEGRKIVEDYASAAVNKALTKQTEKGNYLTRDQFEKELAKERALTAARDNARDNMYGHLAEHGIAPGSPQYHEFAKVSENFKAETLTSKEGIALIVAAMPSSRERAQAQYSPQAGSSLHGEKQIVLDGGMANSQTKPTQTGTADLADRIAAHAKANTGH